MTDIRFPIGQQVSLPGHFDGPVVLEEVRRLGSGYECRVRLPDGGIDEVVISAEEAAALAAMAGVEPRPRPIDPKDLQLLVGSARLRLAHTHDPRFAVSLSGIRTLLHQIGAVYQKMLPQPCLRFLLADGPGAGQGAAAQRPAAAADLLQGGDPQDQACDASQAGCTQAKNARHQAGDGQAGCLGGPRCPGSTRRGPRRNNRCSGRERPPSAPRLDPGSPL